MVEAYVERVHHDIVVDIGDDIGALIIYTDEDLRGLQIDVSMKDNSAARRIHTDVLERRSGGRPVFAAVFVALLAGEYRTWSDPLYTVTIVGGQITELDWRKGSVYVPPVSAMSNETVTSTARSSVLAKILPPRYQGGRTVSAAPMGTAPIRYTENGQVAWNEMWTSFCDLALAGGPPHRDTLLEPVSPDEVRAHPDAYESALAEIERGLRLVTGLPIVRSEKAGWVGVKCADEAMALWLLRAIIVENVCVRREEVVLFLPVGPDFLIEKEIKNVITVVAKTHHYWQEHLINAYGE